MCVDPGGMGGMWGITYAIYPRDGVLEDPKSWPWPLTVPALASKWSGLGLDASASSHRSVINVLNL